MPVLSCLLAFTAVQTGPGDIVVPFRLGEDAIIVDAKVNGKDLSFMFDTGFSGSVIVDSAVNIGPPTGTQVLRDFVGELTASTVKLRSLTLGNKVINTQGMGDAISRPGSDYSFAYNTRVDGIMGFEVIKDNITEINFQTNRFIFHPPGYDISKRTPDNKRTFLARLLPIGGNSLEMSVDLTNGKRIILALDTGNAFYATTHKDVLQRVGLWPDDRKPRYMGSASVASGPVDTFNVSMPPLKIYTVPVENSVWDVIDLPSSSVDGDGTVGFGFLKNFNITIDFGRRRVWLENFTGKVANEPDGEVGISAGYFDQRKRTVVFSVAPESPAAAAGIKELDEILSIDGQELVTAGFRKVRRMLNGPIGTKVKVVVSRNGEVFRHELERKALLNEITMPKE